MITRNLSLCISVIFALFPLSIHAQISMPMTSPLAVDMMVDSEDSKKELRKNRSDKFQPRYQPETSQQLASLTYKYSPALRINNYKSFVTRSMQVDQRAAREWQGVIAKGQDPLRDVSTGLQRSYGFRPNNVADAYTIWISAAWKTVYDPDTELTRAQFDGIRSKIEQALMATPEVAGATDAQKQSFAEDLLINAIVLDSANEQTKNDPVMRKKIQSAVLSKAKENMGLDLSSITLTDQGFVPRKGGKRGDAGEAMEGAEPGTQGSGAMASAAPAPNNGMDGADIALLIAAVSAGAGGIFMIGKGISNQRQG
jgi:hypothetical protein